MKIELRPSTHEDARALAPRLRKDDLNELLAAGYPNAEASLMDGVNSPDGCTTVDVEGLGPVLMFGVGPHPYDSLVGGVWLLGSDDIARIRFPFLRQCRGVIEGFHEKYPVLMNYTDHRNALHHRWLKWCGFVFINTVPGNGPGNLPFYEFVRVRN